MRRERVDLMADRSQDVLSLLSRSLRLLSLSFPALGGYESLRERLQETDREKERERLRGRERESERRLSSWTQTQQSATHYDSHRLVRLISHRFTLGIPICRIFWNLWRRRQQRLPTPMLLKTRYCGITYIYIYIYSRSVLFATAPAAFVFLSLFYHQHATAHSFRFNPGLFRLFNSPIILSKIFFSDLHD